MSEISKSATSNGFEITNPTERINGADYRTLLATEFGLEGDSPKKRIEQLKDLSQEGIAILLEKINAMAQGSGDSLMNHDGMTKIGGKSTISPESRYDVFTSLVDTIKTAPRDISPARVGDIMALGIVLLHPFHDGNGRTARLVGMTFREDYDDIDEYDGTFEALVEPRDEARKRGGFMINGYVPRFPEGFDQSNPEEIKKYFNSLLHDETPSYTGPFGPAALHEQDTNSTELGDLDAEDQIIEAYEEFRDNLHLNDADKAEIIGEGTHSSVTTFEKDGVRYVARSLMPSEKRVEILHSHIAAGARARGVSGLEKIIAGSYEDGVLVSEFEFGEHMDALREEQIASIPNDHFTALIESRIAGMKRGIQFDAHPANILYESSKGFVDIDYHIAQKPYDTIDRVEAMKTVISSLDMTELPLYETDAIKKEHDEMAKTALHRRMNQYMKENFSEAEYDQLWQHLVYVVSMRKTAPMILENKK